ncbi:C9orf156 [Cordylochernes scorpioides]|uniref:C9orf156 n=1 Tax=Cordylochernes scorpioides TaxID=51811 RepID=A0ABY6KLT8_9ARAC|nr:C9orf156 [Cordylochernes scorpioides]
MSHVFRLLCVFHVSGPSTAAKVCPPRLEGQSVGVLSTRSPHRPNPLALSLVELVAVTGNTLTLAGVDLIDGTPVLDVKPYIPQYDSPLASPQDDGPTVRVAQWVASPPRPQLQVELCPRAHSSLQLFHGPDTHSPPCQHCLRYLRGPEDALAALADILAADPRSVYRKAKCSDRIFFFDLDVLHVSCWFDQDLVQVLKICPISEST